MLVVPQQVPSDPSDSFYVSIRCFQCAWPSRMASVTLFGGLPLGCWCHGAHQHPWGLACPSPYQGWSGRGHEGSANLPQVGTFPEAEFRSQSSPTAWGWGWDFVWSCVLPCPFWEPDLKLYSYITEFKKCSHTCEGLLSLGCHTNFKTK